MPTEAEVAADTEEEKPNSETEPGKEQTPAEPKAPSEVETLKAQVEQYRQMAEKAQRDSAQAQEYVQTFIARAQMAAAQAQPTQPSQEDMAQMMNENPGAVLDRHFAERMGPLVERNLGIQAAQAEALFDAKFQQDEDYQAYKGELKEWMRAIPLDTKANPQAWEDALDFIRAKHIKDIVGRRLQKQKEMDKQAFVEAPSGRPGPRTQAVELSADQKAIAKGLGLTEDEYKNEMKEIFG